MRRTFILCIMLYGAVPSNGQDSAFNNFANTLGFKTLQALHKQNPSENLLVNPVALSAFTGIFYNNLSSSDKKKIRESYGIDPEDPRMAIVYKQLKSAAIKSDTLNSSISHACWFRSGSPLLGNIGNQLTLWEETADSVNFSDQGQIDKITDWFARRTSLKPERLLSKVADQNQALYANVNTISGPWRKQFDRSKTTSGIFHNTEKSSVTYMEMKGFFSAGDISDFEYIFLPLMDEKFSLVVYLPLQSSLSEMIAGLDEKMILKPVDYKAVGRTYQLYYSLVQLPKLSVEFDYNPLEVLNLVHKGELESTGVSKHVAVQTSLLKMDESGGNISDDPGRPITRERNVFQAKRPFLYAIINEELKSIVYLGTFVRP
jgi:serine protease inhibitor